MAVTFASAPYRYQHRFRIQPPEGGDLKPFKPTDVQKVLLPKIWEQQKKGPSYHIILKARRMGVTAGVQFLAFAKLVTTPNYVVADIAHRDDSAAAIAYYLKLFWDTMPEELAASLSCGERCNHPQLSCAFRYRREQYWEFVWGSQLKIFTASSEDAARATGSQFLHLSEAAYYPDAARLMRSIMPTLPKGQPGAVVVVESTGQGAEGWFYETYQKAKEAEALRNEGKEPSFLFVPHFFPWYMDSRYRLDTPLIPDERYEEEEQYLRSLGIPDSALAFRRYVIENEFGGDQDAFRQEYPTIEEDAFRRPDLGVFPYGRLVAQQSKAKPPQRMRLIKAAGAIQAVADDTSPLFVFCLPEPGRRYLIGADPAVTASEKSDYAAAVVIYQNAGRLEVAATLQVRADVEAFGKQLLDLARYYNTAHICPDQSSGAGRHIISYLLRKGYSALWQNRELLKRGLPFRETIGMPLNRVTKEMIVSMMQAALWQDTIVLNCPRLIKEAFDYTEHPPGGRQRFGPISRTGHDDLLDACMIAIAAYQIGAPRQLPDRSGWRTYLETLRSLGVRF